jgi:putative ABC transport system ATP-binding protein
VSIVAERLDVTYPGPPPVDAVRNVSMTIESGEYVAIVGPSGSGKTSLLHAIGTLLPPTGGSISLDGRDLGAMSERSRNVLRSTEIGFVFQEPHLIEHRTALENVATGSLYRGEGIKERREHAREALGWVGIGQLAGQMCRTLSGGEKQRVGIARALVGEPSTILCDEPTGNLDSANSASVIRLLKGLREERRITVVVVTHDEEVRRSADRSLEMRDGRLSP